MFSNDINIELSGIRQKLKRLLDQHSALQKENQRLQIENNNAQSKLIEKDEQIKLLTQQIAVLKSGIQQWHPEQKKLFIKRIDAHLKEIEKCLALMNE